MKTRTGFVSNSSSSSFILIVGKETFDKVKDSATPLAKDIMAWLGSDVMLDGKKLVMIEGYSNEDGWTLSNYKIGAGKTGYKKGADPDGEEDLSEVLFDVEERLQANGKGTYIYSYRGN